jgi:hypothetical protein
MSGDQTPIGAPGTDARDGASPAASLSIDAVPRVATTADRSIAPDVGRSPIGHDGPTSVCRCGAGPHFSLAGRCAHGHQFRGSRGLALVTGEHSALFWAEHEQTRREIRDSVIVDAGHTPADAPTALALLADGIAQASLVRDSAFFRIAESGGPLSSAGRARRAFAVWLQSSTQLTNALRLVGLRRVPKPGPRSIAEALMQAPILGQGEEDER